MILFLIVWFCLSFLVACHAYRCGKHPAPWFVSAVIFTPILTIGVLYAITGKVKQE